MSSGEEGCCSRPRNNPTMQGNAECLSVSKVDKVVSRVRLEPLAPGQGKVQPWLILHEMKKSSPH